MISKESLSPNYPDIYMELVGISLILDGIGEEFGQILDGIGQNFAKY